MVFTVVLLEVFGLSAPQTITASNPQEENIN